MDSYYTSPSSHREAAQVLYVREPFHNSFSEAPTLPGNMMMYVTSGPYSDALSENSQLKTNYVAIPTIGSSNSTSQQQEIFTNLGGLRTIQQDVGVWREGRNEMLVTNPTAAQNMLSQGLSLSLGTEMPSDIQMASMPGGNATAGVASFLSPNSSTSGEVGNRVASSRDDPFRNRDYLSSGLPGGNQDFNKGDYSLYGMPDVARTIPNSKYLKAAQQLLDEVVNVCIASKLSGDQKNQSSFEDVLRSSKDTDGGQKDDTTSAGISPNPRDSSGNSQSELSHSERQELQNKLSKLLSMLAEVDRRYRQYYHQMQIVISSFDAIAGCGAAKPYTSVALQTISRHFRCLRDAITGQIRSTQRSLGEQESSWNGNDIGITRLRFVDQQLRQQRALQQIGMMQQNAWRPQRGLPESSVLILRAWLFEHFLHPYPKDSDKIMLARQTGLTRSQVSNWFINARVRLWKPMVEEMYKEELGDEMDPISSFEAAGKATKGDATAPEGRVDDLEQSQNATTSERYKTGNLVDSNLDGVPDLETARSAGFTNMHIVNSVNHEGRTDCGMVRQTEGQRSNVDDCSMLSDAAGQSGGGGDSRLMAAAAAAYQMSELERFGTENGVSLTLRLQHCEGGNSHMTSGGHQGFVPMRVDDMYDAASSSSMRAETAELECVGTGNQHRRFSSSHLVHDFAV